VSGDLRRMIALPQAVALYVAAVVGAGVLILPGLAATEAGPASIISWACVSLLGVPLALTFASLASRYPDPGGVATYVTLAFGAGPGAAAGWFYFIAAATGQIIVPLTGAYYVAAALALGTRATFLLAGAILAFGVGANLFGLGVSGRAALLLSAGIALLLLAAAALALPRMEAGRWRPFAPHGWGAVGRAGALIFFAFFGWEAIAHLSAEFRDPERDVPRATLYAVGLVTLLYVGVAVAIVGTGTYGSPELDRVAVARLRGDSLGVGATGVAAAMALVIATGTSNAFVAAASRLAYALARDDAFPAALGRLDRKGVPRLAVLAVGTYAAAGLALSYFVGWGADAWLPIPNALGIATYIIGGAAGVKLLRGSGRWMALASCALCAAILPFAGVFALLPPSVAVATALYRRRRSRRTAAAR
jgi:amino acid efflux transporter